MELSTPSLVILIGPSGAGKSTWAADQFEPNEIVSSDSLRGVVGAGDDDQTASPVAFEILERIVEERLRRGMTTVVDTLGFDDESRERWASWASSSGMPVRLVAFETPPAVSESRNAQRDRPVPKTVLRKQRARFKEVIAALDDITVVTVSDDTLRVQEQAPPKVAQASGNTHTFGLIVSRFNWSGDDLAARLTDIGTRAEAAGFRDIWVMDHFRQIPQVGRKWEDMPEAYTTLSFMAGVTDHIRLGALVTGITHRHPVLLGKMIASLDVLSGGRVICGLGIAWDQDEHAAYGMAFPTTSERYERLEETLQMLPLLWGKGSPSFDGDHIDAQELICYPRPIQDPIPIMIGGSGEKKTLRLVAEYGDAANVFGDPETVRHKVSVIEAHCAEVDRDPDEIEVTHLTNAIVASTRRDLMSRAHHLRDRNQTAEDFLKRNRGGTVDQAVDRFSEYSKAGSAHSIVSLPDLHFEGSIEAFGEVIARMGSS